MSRWRQDGYGTNTGKRENLGGIDRTTRNDHLTRKTVVAHAVCKHSSLSSSSSRLSAPAQVAGSRR